MANITFALGVEELIRLAWQNRDDAPDSLDIFAGKMVDRLHQTVKPGPLGKP